MSATARAVDTSVSVPLLHAGHPSHGLVTTWATDKALHLSGHAIVETYAVLTRLPGDARVSPADAVLLLEENFGPGLALSPNTLRTAHREFAASGVAGGAAYDGLVALAARETGMILATRDERALATYQAVGISVEIVLPTA